MIWSCWFNATIKPNIGKPTVKKKLKQNNAKYPPFPLPLHPTKPPLLTRAAGFRDVAQPGSALAWGARGRWFESSRPDRTLQVIDLKGFLYNGPIK